MPQTIISRSLLQDYAKRLANALLQNFPKDKETIAGDEIKSFSPVKQINLFILKSIFLSWNEEIIKFRSKWFNYEHPEVKSALDNFMNVLSHNIKISRTDFESLLNISTEETLRLIFFPGDFLFATASQNQNNFTWEEIERFNRFICIHKNLINSLVNKIKEKSQSKQTFSREEGKVYFDSLMESNFSNPYDLVKEHLVSVQKICPFPFPAGIESTPETSKINIQEPQPVLEGAGMGLKETLALNDKFKRDKATLNETLKNVTEKETILDKMRLTKIQDLNAAISISQKFIFIKEIFDSKTEKYDAIIQKLNNCSDFESAKQIFIGECFAGADFKEKMEQKPVKEMMELLERRFQD